MYPTCKMCFETVYERRLQNMVVVQETRARSRSPHPRLADGAEPDSGSAHGPPPEPAAGPADGLANGLAPEPAGGPADGPAQAVGALQ